MMLWRNHIFTWLEAAKWYLPEAAPTTESDEEMAESIGQQNFRVGMVSMDDNKPVSACISSVAGGGHIKMTNSAAWEAPKIIPTNRWLQY